MYTFLIGVHVVVAILLIVVILMQSSKGGGLSGAFGGGAMGGGQSLFGGRGAASFLQKVTVALAIVFMVLALSISLIGRSGESQQSVVQQEAQQSEVSPGTSLPQPSGTSEGQGLLPVEEGQNQQTTDDEQSQEPEQQGTENPQEQ